MCCELKNLVMQIIRQHELAYEKESSLELLDKIMEDDYFVDTNKIANINHMEPLMRKKSILGCLINFVDQLYQTCKSNNNGSNMQHF